MYPTYPAYPAGKVLAIRAGGDPQSPPALTSLCVPVGRVCGVCGASYGALSYGFGRTTETAHTGDRCPGIYHVHAEHERKLLADLVTVHAALPRVLAIGEVDCDVARPTRRCIRGRRFTVRRLAAVCSSCRRLVESGEVQLARQRHSDLLAPLCRRCVAASRELAPWRLVLDSPISVVKEENHAWVAATGKAFVA